MLRAVAFQNFIKFRHHQSLDFEVGPNFFVGPNGSGKSAIFELIRRCLSQIVNISTSTVADKNNPAFVISKFEISQELSDNVPKDCLVYSCLYIKGLKDNSKDMYKLVCVTNTDKKQGNCYLDYYHNVKDSCPLPRPEAFTLPTDSTELSDELEKLMESGRSLDKLDDMILKMMGDNKQPAMHVESSIIHCETILQAIQNAVVVTFPIRSPGTIQWSDSKLFRRRDDYKPVENNAEILQQLLQPSSDVDKEDANEIFKTIICPLEYNFEIEKSSITVSDGEGNVPFVKLPEGIIEAKQFSLMMAHKKYQTLVLEEPDRGMHPHMTQKIRDLVLRTHTKDTKETKGTNATKDTTDTKDQRKVLLLTTHQTAMINQWSMSRMFICRRTMNAGIMEHRVFKLSSRIKRIYELEDILKEMVFSESVLFVEGFTDKKVIRSVFDRVLEADGSSEIPDLPVLQKMAARTQIISIGGKRHDISDALEQTGKELDIPCKFLVDTDDLPAEVEPIEKVKKWKNKASSCARILLKRTEEYFDENQVEESKGGQEILNSVMGQLTKENIKGGVKIKDMLGLKEDLQKVEITDVVSFIRRVVLPEPLLKQNAEETKKKNEFRWESGNLENVICKSILGDQTEVQQSTASTSNQTDVDVGLLLKMFLCKHYDESKPKDPVKETLKQMDIETAKALSTRLLKRGEMMSFLHFLLDTKKPNRD